jgi:hypothetical protein
MNRIEKLITNLTIQTFKSDEEMPESTSRKQISLRPSVSVLCQIDTLADILDQSRQMLMDEFLEGALMDAIDAYCDAHGPNHSEEARKGFMKLYFDRWEQMNKESEK